MDRTMCMRFFTHVDFINFLTGDSRQEDPITAIIKNIDDLSVIIQFFHRNIFKRQTAATDICNPAQLIVEVTKYSSVIIQKVISSQSSAFAGSVSPCFSGFETHH